MKRIRLYQTLSAPTTEQLDTLVCMAINNGMQPIGGIATAPRPRTINGTLYVQAMVEYERPACNPCVSYPCPDCGAIAS